MPMLDDPEQTERFLAALKAAVPFEAQVSPAAMRQVLEDSGHGHGRDGRLVRSRSKPLEPGATASVIMFVSGSATAVLGHLGSKWIGEYLWPEFKRHLDAPSKAFVKWLCDRLSLPATD
jgi:hypothetical protein